LKITKNDRPFAGNYQVLSPNEFIDDLEKEATRAKTRVWTQAMFVDGGTIFDRLDALLSDAASRDLDSRLHADWFSLKFSGGKYMRPHSEQYKTKIALFDSLKNRGVSILFTNKPTLFEHAFPYKGRNHMKMTIVDNLVYLGGVNYADDDFQFADFMVKFTDRDIVSAVHKLFLRVETNRLRDEKIQINTETCLFVDAGRAGKSIILKEAIRAAKTTKNTIYHTCQFVPDGAFLRALHKAYLRKCEVDVISPDKNSFSRMLSGVYNLNRFAIRIKRQHVPVHFLSRMVHAKLTIVDNQYILMGSHNLSLSGVRVGTAEVALASHNPELVHNLTDYFADLLATTKL
jgi:phosphatidylserine/phosphatidylglycerophosphate/cardiolipin synthase-like enzyme